MIAARRPGILLLAGLILLVGAAFLTQIVPYRQIIDSNRRVESARAQLASLQTENEVLQADVDALHTEQEIEKLAREKLGYVRPGETAYVVLDPPGQADPPPATEQRPVEPDKTWVDRVWDFLTGGDLAD